VAAAVEERISLRAAVKTLNTPAFRRLAGAAVLLSVATASDAFIYLALQEQLDLDTMLFPLLATGTAVTYMSLAAPLGRLADRIGRHRVFLGGYVMLLAAYVALVAGLPGAVGIAIVLFLLGTYYAATDGVLMALGSAHVSDEMRGSGLAVLGTATSVSRLGASLLFGVLWAALGIETAFLCFAVGLAVTIPLTRWMLGRSSAHA
jgi:MFS family permease